MADLRLDLNKGPQREAFHSLATEILYGGAAGGGKSHLMRVAAITWMAAVPGIQGYLFRKNYPDLIQNHLEGPHGLLAMMAPWIQRKWAKWNWARMELEIYNGAKLHLRHVQHDTDVLIYQGSEIHFLLMDELTHFSAYVYRYLRGRCRIAGLKVPDWVPWAFPRICNGSNPGGVGHNWVKACWIDPAAPYVIVKQSKKEGGMLRQFIPAKIIDNPYLAVDDPDYIEKLEGLGDPALVKALKDGDWNIVAGGMFDDVWKPEFNTCLAFDIPKGWPITRSFDWGSSKPFSVGWWTESNGEEVTLRDGSKRTWPKGHRFRINEWYGWNGQPNEGCRMLAVDIAAGILEKELTWGWAGRVKPGAADSSIYDTQDGKCIATEMAGVGVTFEKADKSPGSRVNGWELVRQMLKAAHQFPQEKPGLTVFIETGTHFIRCLPVLPRDKRKTDDVDTNAEDHNGDEARYELSRVSSVAVKIPLTGA